MRALTLYNFSSSFLLILCIYSIVLGAGSGSIKYVEPASMGGSNSNGGTSASDAYATLEYALNNMGSATTLIVLGDSDNDTDDFIETIEIANSITVEGSNLNGAYPRVKASEVYQWVIHISTSSVTVRNLELHMGDSVNGTIFEISGTSGNRISDCLVENNVIGISSVKHAHRGIHMYKADRCVVRNNQIQYHSSHGIYMHNCNSNIFFNNTVYYCTSGGIVLTEGCDGNIFVRDKYTYSTNQEGISLEDVTDNNIFSECETKYNEVGINISGTHSNIFLKNDAIGNWVNMLFAVDPSPSIFSMQYLANPGQGNVYNSAGYTLYTQPVPWYYTYNGKNSGAKLGNYYDEYGGGTDAEGDGVIDYPYTYAMVGDPFSDMQPLVGDPRSDYDLWAWSFNFDSSAYGGHLFKNDFGSIHSLYNEKEIGPYSSYILFEQTPAPSPRIFSGGSEAEGDTWHGWVTLVFPSSVAYPLNIEVGHSLNNGFDWTAGGPSAVIRGDGFTRRLEFICSAGRFTVPKGRRLALRITNPGPWAQTLRLGGAAGVLIAPAGSRMGSPSLPVLNLLLE